MILALRLGRRLIGVCGFEHESFAFKDSRYVGRKATLESTVPAYIAQLLEQIRPSAVYVYAPGATEALPNEVLALVEKTCAERGMPSRRLNREDITHAFGLQPLRMRRALHEVILHIWPELSSMPAPRQLVLAEAAATALIGDLRERWPLV